MTEVEYALVLRTAHIPYPGFDRVEVDADDWMLDEFDGAKRPRCNPHDCGWVVFLGAGLEVEGPEWFLPIHDWCLRNDISFVIFDECGQVSDDFPTYEW